MPQESSSYFESSEYNNAFGDFIVPYYRGFQSIPGMKQVGVSIGCFAYIGKMAEQ